MATLGADVVKYERHRLKMDRSMSNMPQFHARVCNYFVGLGVFNSEDRVIRHFRPVGGRFSQWNVQTIRKKKWRKIMFSREDVEKFYVHCGISPKFLMSEWVESEADLKARRTEKQQRRAARAAAESKEAEEAKDDGTEEPSQPEAATDQPSQEEPPEESRQEEPDESATEAKDPEIAPELVASSKKSGKKGKRRSQAWKGSQYRVARKSSTDKRRKSRKKSGPRDVGRQSAGSWKPPKYDIKDDDGQSFLAPRRKTVGAVVEKKKKAPRKAGPRDIGRSSYTPAPLTRKKSGRKRQSGPQVPRLAKAKSADDAEDAEDSRSRSQSPSPSPESHEFGVDVPRDSDSIFDIPHELLSPPSDDTILASGAQTPMFNFPFHCTWDDSQVAQAYEWFEPVSGKMNKGLFFQGLMFELNLGHTSEGGLTWSHDTCDSIWKVISDSQKKITIERFAVFVRGEISPGETLLPYCDTIRFRMEERLELGHSLGDSESESSEDDNSTTSGEVDIAGVSTEDMLETINAHKPNEGEFQWLTVQAYCKAIVDSMIEHPGAFDKARFIEPLCEFIQDQRSAFVFTCIELTSKLLDNDPMVFEGNVSEIITSLMMALRQGRSKNIIETSHIALLQIANCDRLVRISFDTMILSLIETPQEHVEATVHCLEYIATVIRLGKRVSEISQDQIRAMVSDNMQQYLIGGLNHKSTKAKHQARVLVDYLHTNFFEDESTHPEWFGKALKEVEIWKMKEEKRKARSNRRRHRLRRRKSRDEDHPEESTGNDENRSSVIITEVTE